MAVACAVFIDPCRCNSALKQCVSNSSVATCRSSGDCATGFFCDSGSSTCAAVTPLGGACKVTGDWNGVCANGGYCYNNSRYDLFTGGEMPGVCVAPNTMATGTVAWGPLADYAWSYAATWGFKLCASG